PERASRFESGRGYRGACQHRLHGGERSSRQPPVARRELDAPDDELPAATRASFPLVGELPAAELRRPRRLRSARGSRLARPPNPTSAAGSSLRRAHRLGFSSRELSCAARAARIQLPGADSRDTPTPLSAAGSSLRRARPLRFSFRPLSRAARVARIQLPGADGADAPTAPSAAGSQANRPCATLSWLPAASPDPSPPSHRAAGGKFLNDGPVKFGWRKLAEGARPTLRQLPTAETRGWPPCSWLPAAPRAAPGSRSAGVASLLMAAGSPGARAETRRDHRRGRC